MPDPQKPEGRPDPLSFTLSYLPRWPPPQPPCPPPILVPGYETPEAALKTNMWMMGPNPAGLADIGQTPTNVYWGKVIYMLGCPCPCPPAPTPAPPGGGGGTNVIVSDTAPSGATVGNLWWDTVHGQLYVWYDDGTSRQWVVANNNPGVQGVPGPIGPSGASVVTIGATPPPSPVIGNLWWDDVGGQLYIYYNDGTSTQWVAAANMSGH